MIDSEKCINLMYHIRSLDWKLPKSGLLPMVFPHFVYLVLKLSSTYADFALRGVYIPPRIRADRGLPVSLSTNVDLKDSFDQIFASAYFGLR